MATITRFPLVSHLHSGPNHHILHYRHGRRIRSGRGLDFWFVPLTSSIAEVPCDDHDQPFLFHGRSRDFQDVAVQGTITYRVSQPEAAAERFDFTIDVGTGQYLKTPLEQLSELLTQLAQQLAADYLNRTMLRDLLGDGLDEIRRRLRQGLMEDANLIAMGLEIVSVRVAALTPKPDLEKALQAPTREAIQQQSDEAVFQRRALAVEKERAIAENELHNRIELARREEELISQQGQNRKREAQDEAEAARIQAEASAERRRIGATARADSIRTVEEAQVIADGQRMDIYRSLPPSVLLGLAARELAGNLHRIDHLNLGGDSMGPLLTNLLQAGVRHLDQPPANGNGQNEA